MFYSKEEKQLLGRYFKYYRNESNIKIKEITSTGICEYRTYKKVEEGKPVNDDLIDSLMQYYKIDFEVINILRKVNPSIEELYDACEWYDKERIKGNINAIVKQLNYFSSKPLINELLESLGIIERQYISNKYLNEREIHETFKLIQLWNNKLSSLLIEVCGLSNTNIAVSSEIAYKIGDYANKNDLIGKYWYAKSCVSKKNYIESLEIYNYLENEYNKSNNLIRKLNILQRKYLIYRDTDDKKANEFTKVLLDYLRNDKIVSEVKAPIYYNVAMYYYLNSRYKEALECYEKHYETKKIENALLFICACRSRLNILNDFDIKLNSESVLYPYIQYFYLKSNSKTHKELENYILSNLMPILMKEKYEYPFWNMFNYELSQLVKKTRNYKKYLEFQENMQFATKNAT